MAYIKRPQEFFEAELSRLLRRPLYRRETYSVGPVKTPAEFGATSARNSACVATFDDVPYLVLYDRQDLGTWLAASQGVLRPMAVTNTAATTTHELWHDFDKLFQLDIPVEQIVDAPVDLTSGSVRFDVVGNHWFTGGVTVTIIPIVQSDEDMAIAIDWTPRPFEFSAADRAKYFPNITDVNYDQRLNITALTYGIDYSASNTALAALTPIATLQAWTNISTANGSSLAAALKAVDGLPWVYSSTLYTVPYNILNGAILYNGPTLGFRGRANITDWDQDSAMDELYVQLDQLVNRDYDSVLIFMPNLNGNSNLRGAVVAHYGGKVRDYAALSDVLPDPAQHWPMIKDGSNLAPGGKAIPAGSLLFDNWPNYDSRARIPGNAAYALGTDLDVSGDFTLSFDYWRGANDTAGPYGILGDGSTVWNGAIYYTSGGYFYIGGSATKWENGHLAARLRNYAICTVTMVKAGTLCYVYMDGDLAAIYTVTTPTVKKLNFLGKNGGYGPGLRDTIGNLQYWPAALNAKQVAKIKKGDYFVGKPDTTGPEKPYSKFDRIFPLTKDAKDTLSLTNAMISGEWQFVDQPSGKWGSLIDTAQHVPFGFGSLPLTGEFYYDFEYLQLTSSTYMTILVNGGDGDGYNAATTGSIYLYGGRPYIYGVTNVSPYVITLNTPARIAIVGRDGMISLYLNGVLQQSVAQVPGLSLNGFRNAETVGQFRGGMANMRNFRIATHRMTDVELADALAGR